MRRMVKSKKSEKKTKEKPRFSPLESLEKLEAELPAADRQHKVNEDFRRGIEKLTLQTDALNYATMGFSHQEIADKLSIAKADIPALLVEAFGEYTAKRDAAADEAFAKLRRRFDRLYQKWVPLAEGYVDKNGRAVEPDAKAARIVLGMQREEMRLFGFMSIRIEHSGHQKITNIQVDWTGANDDELLASANGSIEVLQSLGGRTPSRLPPPSGGEG